jgi:hypothetical protein
VMVGRCFSLFSSSDIFFKNEMCFLVTFHTSTPSSLSAYFFWKLF